MYVGINQIRIINSFDHVDRSKVTIAIMLIININVMWGKNLLYDAGSNEEKISGIISKHRGVYFMLWRHIVYLT